MSMRGAVGVALLLAVTAVTLWVLWSPASKSRPAQYVCNSGDTLTATVVDTTRLRLRVPDGPSQTLRRVDSRVGTTYRDSSLFFWTDGSSATLHHGSEPLQIGCSAAPSDTAAYASPPHVDGWRFVLRHTPAMGISRPNDHTTRVLYAGPNNEPPALTDGFTLTLRIVERSDSTSLPAYVENETERISQIGGAVLEAPIDTTHRDRPARRWRQESAMGGAVSHWAIALPRKTIAHVSSSTISADTVTYDAQARFVRESLRFWRSAENARRPRTVPLAFLQDPHGAPERGCDEVVFVDMPVRSSESRLSSAMDTLFALDRDSVNGARHFLARTNETLHFDRATVADDTARVYLTGRLTGLRGVCDNPRARIQIEETARRVAGVRHVVLYRNGDRTNLQPDGRGSSP